MMRENLEKKSGLNPVDLLKKQIKNLEESINLKQEELSMQRMSALSTGEQKIDQSIVNEIEVLKKKKTELQNKLESGQVQNFSAGKRKSINMAWNDHVAPQREVQREMQTQAEQAYGSDFISPRDKSWQVEEMWNNHEKDQRAEQSAENFLNTNQKKIEDELLKTQEQLYSLRNQPDNPAVQTLQNREKSLIEKAYQLRLLNPDLYDGSYDRAKEAVKQKAQEASNTPSDRKTWSDPVEWQKRAYEEKYGKPKLPSSDNQKMDEVKKTLDSVYAGNTDSLTGDSVVSDPNEWLEEGYGTKSYHEEEKEDLDKDSNPLTRDSIISDPNEWQERGYPVNEWNDENFENSKKVIEEDLEDEEKKPPVKDDQKGQNEDEPKNDPVEEEKKQEVPLDDNTHGMLVELGIDPEEVFERIPEFKYMSEGQRAYILQKSREQNFERIQDDSEDLFKQNLAKANWFKRNINPGSVRRASNKEAVALNKQRGLSVFENDIRNLTHHVESAGWDISIDTESKTGYRIKYLSEDAQTIREQGMVLEYNKAATAFSDIPYEWGLDTATSRQKKAFQKAFENLKKAEDGILIKEKPQNPQEETEVQLTLNKARSEAEMNQYFSSYPEVNELIRDHKEATFMSDLVKNYVPFLTRPASQVKQGALAGGIARNISKTWLSFGTATGLAMVIGGIQGWVRKNDQLRTEAINARRSGGSRKSEAALNREGKNIKVKNKIAEIDKETRRFQRELDKLEAKQSSGNLNENDQNAIAYYSSVIERLNKQKEKQQQNIKEGDTTYTVLDGEKSTDKIESLLVKIDATDPQDPKYAELMSSLATRIKFTQQRMKEGRVDYGKANYQLRNKYNLIQVLAEAETALFASGSYAQAMSGIGVNNPDLGELQSQYNSRIEELQDRLESKTEGTDKRTKKERNKARAKAIAWGAARGGTAAAAAWLIGWLSETVPEARLGMMPEPLDPSVVDRGVTGPFPYEPGDEIPGIPEINPNPTDFVVSVDASSRGAIATFADLQEQLENKYGGDFSQAPQHIQEFMSKSPTELAIEENMYRPNDINGNESAKIYKGGKLGFNTAGQLVYTDARTGVDILSGESTFDGGHFDYGARQAAQEASRQNVTSSEGFKDMLNKSYYSDADSTIINPENSRVKVNDFVTETGQPVSYNQGVAGGNSASVFESQFNSGSGAVSPEVETISDAFDSNRSDTVNILGSNVEYSIVETPNGEEVEFGGDFDPGQISRYYDKYLGKDFDIQAYANDLYEKGNQDISAGGKVNKADFNNSIRAMIDNVILRDQVMANSTLSHDSDLYGLLKKERGLILGKLEKYAQAASAKVPITNLVSN